MKNILVAVDEPKEADQLIFHAVKLAKLSNAKIWIIHVNEADPEDYLAREAGPQYIYEKRAEESKKEAKEFNTNFIIMTPIPLRNCRLLPPFPEA